MNDKKPVPKWLACRACGFRDVLIREWVIVPGLEEKRPWVMCRVCGWRGHIYGLAARWTQQELDNGDHRRA